jgi:hypothetical protein
MITIKKISGEIAYTIEQNKLEYSYDEIKNIFVNTIIIDSHYCIVKDNIIIFTDLYDLYNCRQKNYKLDSLNIIFYQYDKNDTLKIRTFFQNVNNYNVDKTKTLQSAFNLSKDDLYEDKVFMSFCINVHADLLFYASDELKKSEIIFYGFGQRSTFLEYISDELKNNKKFINCIPHTYIYSSDTIKDDYDTTLYILKYNINFIRYMSNRLKNDKSLFINIINHELNKIPNDEDYTGYHLE